MVPLLLVLLPGAPGQVRVDAQQSDRALYFPRTGHWVTDDFLDYYLAEENADVVFGDPLTEAFKDVTTGWTIQYFQKARFELHPQSPPELRVQLAPLGEYLYEPEQTVAIPENFPDCRLYSETGFEVCYDFYDFFEHYGGVAQFGYPISNLEWQDGVMVQYFQRSRLEWRPGNPSGESVVNANLGEAYFRLHEDPILRTPIRSAAIPQAILDIKAHVFPARSILTQGDQQTIYVIIRDQNQLPVANARVAAVVSSPSGEDLSFDLPLTDRDGLTQFSFTAKAPAPYQTRVWITANYEGKQTLSRTSFRTWW